MRLGRVSRTTAGALALLAVGQAHAAYTVELREVGGNVVATGSGTIVHPPVAGPTSLGTQSAVRGAGLGAIFSIGGAPLTANLVDAYDGLTGPSTIGTSVALTAADVASGDMVRLDASGRLFVPPMHISGGGLSSSSTWTGATFASLGLTPGTYRWTWGTGPTADAFTLNIGPVAAAPVAIPTLSEWGLLATSAALALGAVVWMRRRHVG